MGEQRPCEGHGHRDEQRDRDRRQERSQAHVDRVLDPGEALRDRFTPGLRIEPLRPQRYCPVGTTRPTSRRADFGLPASGLTETIRSPFLPAIFAQSSGLVVLGRSSFSLNSSRTAQSSPPLPTPSPPPWMSRPRASPFPPPPLAPPLPPPAPPPP